MAYIKPRNVGVVKKQTAFLVTLQQELNSPYTEYKENDSN